MADRGVMCSMQQCTEEMPRFERETFLSMLRDAPYGLAVIERDGRCLYVNRTFTTITGYTQQEVPTIAAWFDRAHPNPAYRRKVMETWNDTISGRQGAAVFSAVCGDGKVREIEMRPTVLEDGKTVLALQDVTERVMVEELLRQTTSELEAVIDAFPDLYLRVNFDGTIIDCRAGMVADVPFLPQGLLGRRLQDVIPGASGRAIRDALQGVHTSNTPASLEFPLPDDGGERHVEARILPLYEKHLMVIVRDITESKRMENELRRSENLYRTIFETTGSATAILEADGTVAFANAQFESAFGYSPDELQGLNFWDTLLPDADQERIRDYHARVVAGAQGLPHDCELHVIHRSGDVRDVLMTMGAIPDTRRCVVSLLDITSRKKAEQQIIDQLKEKEILLKEIHHRVKNNLQIISSLLNLQSRYVQDAEIRNIARDCQNRIRSLSIIHENLYRSKDLGRVDFEDYLRRLVDGLFSAYNVPSDTIRYTVRAENVTLGIDTAIPSGLIVNELVSNCLKHAFPHGRRGHVSVELCRGDDGEITLSVSDDGVGLPETVDFRNTDSLGMHLVCSLVDQLTGTIELFRGPGTTFLIRFFELRYKDRGVIR